MVWKPVGRKGDRILSDAVIDRNTRNDMSVRKAIIAALARIALARIHALLRRGAPHAQRLRCGDIALDDDHQSVTVAGARTETLTGLEFRLLRCFMHHAGEVLSKSWLCEHVYGLDQDPASNVIEVYVNRLRQKLGKDSIQTRRGQGYVFAGGPKP